MRSLTKKQKDLLTTWFNEKCPNITTRVIFNRQPTLISYKDLNLEQIKILEEINDTEILYQNINRFLNDLYCKWSYEK